MGDPAFDITGLTPDERLELIEHLWDSLTPQDVPLTEAQQEELQRRLERLERDGVSGRPWDEVERRVRSRGQR
jgi:putative addiction module component (TIGR02574 family)